MKIHFTPEFLQDLTEIDDARFVRRVLRQVLDNDGEFRQGKEDHRYHGIQDAWIRYVSSGKTAYRVIYIRAADSVFLYRAGPHSIEDRLRAPRGLASAAVVQAAPDTPQPQLPYQGWSDSGELLKTTQAVMLRKVVHSLRFVGHREIFLISPYVDEDTLARWAPLGQFIDRAIEEGTVIWLITRPPEPERLAFYRGLEERGMGVFFYRSLHAKLFVFDINTETLGQYTKDMRPTAIVGSANLTEMGLALSNETSNEELCYRLPAVKFSEAKDYAYWLMNHADDVAAYTLRITRRF